MLNVWVPEKVKSKAVDLISVFGICNVWFLTSIWVIKLLNLMRSNSSTSIYLLIASNGL